MSKPTRREYKDAYKAWQKMGHRQHQALWTIWRSLTPDSEYSTFGSDPEVVLDAFLAHLAEDRAAAPVPALPSLTEDDGGLIEAEKAELERRSQ